VNVLTSFCTVAAAQARVAELNRLSDNLIIRSLHECRNRNHFGQTLAFLHKPMVRRTKPHRADAANRWWLFDRFLYLPNWAWFRCSA